MNTEVDELIDRIRNEADTHLARESPEAKQSYETSVVELDHLRGNLAIILRAEGQLPPVTTYRRGRMAKIELWIKRRLKTATRWFTWEQTNFNLATSAALHNILAILLELNDSVKELRHQIKDGTSKAPSDASVLLETRLRAIETDLQTLLTPWDSLRDEQRVCFRQLSIQISEAAIISDRANRNLRMQLDQLAQRLEELETDESSERDGTS